jgi:ATP-dependent DNA ligase
MCFHSRGRTRLRSVAGLRNQRRAITECRQRAVQTPPKQKRQHAAGRRKPIAETSDRSGRLLSIRFVWHDGHDLTGKSVLQRRDRLQQIITPIDGIQVGGYRRESRNRP